MNWLSLLTKFGPLELYQRGAWAKAEKLPRYVVMYGDRIVKEFRQARHAITWLRRQGEK